MREDRTGIGTDSSGHEILGARRGHNAALLEAGTPSREKGRSLAALLLRCRRALRLWGFGLRTASWGPLANGGGPLPSFLGLELPSPLQRFGHSPWGEGTRATFVDGQSVVQVCRARGAVSTVGVPAP